MLARYLARHRSRPVRYAGEAHPQDSLRTFMLLATRAHMLPELMRRVLDPQRMRHGLSDEHPDLPDYLAKQPQLEDPLMASLRGVGSGNPHAVSSVLDYLAQMGVPVSHPFPPPTGPLHLFPLHDVHALLRQMHAKMAPVLSGSQEGNPLIAGFGTFGTTDPAIRRNLAKTLGFGKSLGRYGNAKGDLETVLNMLGRIGHPLAGRADALMPGVAAGDPIAVALMHDITNHLVTHGESDYERARGVDPMYDTAGALREVAMPQMELLGHRLAGVS